MKTFLPKFIFVKHSVILCGAVKKIRNTLYRKEEKTNKQKKKQQQKITTKNSCIIQ